MALLGGLFCEVPKMVGVAFWKPGTTFADNFFLITKGDQDDLYKKRYETNYQEMLFPLYEAFKETIRKTRGISILNDTIDFTELPFNDVSELTARDGMYGRKRPSENATVPDIWDAIVIHGLNLEINEDCFPQFKIKK